MKKKFKIQSTHFLAIISIVISLFSISLIIFYNEFFRSKYLEEQEKINFKNEVYQIAKKLISCLGEEKEGIFYINKSKLDKFSKLYEEIEPRCAIADSFDYTVKVIQLEKEIRNYPFNLGGGCGWAWVINSGAGKMHSSVSLVTSDGKELRRHYTSPNMDGDPSRTAVDKMGNIWVGNRNNNLLVKIAFDKNLCKEKIPEDVNKNGKIDEDEMISFNEDGCILKKVYLEDCYRGDRGIRAVCIDKDENVYVGCWDSRKLFKISKDGEIEKEWRLPSRPYGCVVGNDGKVYITTLSSNILILDPESGNIENINIGTYEATYGVWRCYNLDCIVFSTWQDGGVILFDTTSKKIIWKNYCGSYTRGVFVDKENNIYVVSSSHSKVCKFNFKGKLIKEALTCKEPTGISMDACGNLWVECRSSGIDIFDTDLNKINSFTILGSHYTYSDFTGFLSDARVEIAEVEERKIIIERKEWNFGLRGSEVLGGKISIGPKIYYETSISLPILIKYNETHIIEGILVITAYKGFLEIFYSFLDSLCSKEIKELEISKKFYFDYDVKVFKDKVCSENVCKKLVCNYDIEEKEFKKGENIINIKIYDGKLIFS